MDKSQTEWIGALSGTGKALSLGGERFWTGIYIYREIYYNIMVKDMTGRIPAPKTLFLKISITEVEEYAAI